MSTYTIVVEPDEDGGFFVVVPALPGCCDVPGRSCESFWHLGAVIWASGPGRGPGATLAR